MIFENEDSLIKDYEDKFESKVVLWNDGKCVYDHLVKNVFGEEILVKDN
eukprot:CAMPEP_0170515146 /NCGR_PEP_ID=MMETSP0209-20121228/1615_1 /TAXON_ID=665100 ORGANISM="Litonotus pictus, Strain P1" /NCGR_SAMPLE_ID=MMETSP0209 /ASSEMBLY_ACC=CAM_ASM_000301 /LENGTH=48 /DNA_ID= /DNA_START= /DNA_END= /DNA_ORIENTATION=